MPWVTRGLRNGVLTTRLPQAARRLRGQLAGRRDRAW